MATDARPSVLAEANDLADAGTLDIVPGASGQSIEIQELVVSQDCQLVALWDPGDTGTPSEHGHVKALKAGVHMGLKLLGSHDGTNVKAGYRIKNNSGVTMDVLAKGVVIT